VTVIVAMPAERAVTKPVVEMLATVTLLLVQLTFLLVALSGEMVAVSWLVVPAFNERLVSFRDTPAAATGAGVTVTVQLAALLPSSVVTVIVAVPVEMAVTKPASETFATDGLLLTQRMFLLVALEGETVAVNWPVEPICKGRLVGVRDTDVTGMTCGVTVTTQLAVLLPSSVMTVMVAVPVEKAVTVPVVETFATEVLLLCQRTVLLLALEGKTVAVSWLVAPMIKDRLEGVRVTSVTAMLGTVTVRLQLAVLLPSTVVTVIVAVPGSVKLITPLDTVATSVLLELQETLLLVALAGNIVAISVTAGSPTCLLRELWLNDTPLTRTVSEVGKAVVVNRSSGL